MSDIYFNSKSQGPYNYLSNFYGDVEIEFMKRRFENEKMRGLFDEFKECDSDRFIFYLKLLQPDKKFTEKKEKYWFYGDEPIRGILAKLVGSIVVKPANFKKRIKAISVHLGISIEDVVKTGKITTDEDMYDCLMKKYKIEKYKKLLLETGNKSLHEKPLRGRPNAWTYNKDGEGGDKLGKMLMRLRSGIKLADKLVNSNNFYNI